MNCKTLGSKDMPGGVWGIQQSADVYEYASWHRNTKVYLAQGLIF